MYAPWQLHRRICGHDKKKRTRVLHVFCTIRSIQTKLQAYSDFLEQELLDLFERAAGRSPPEVELMKECSDILFALNEGEHLQSRFVFYVVTQVCFLLFFFRLFVCFLFFVARSPEKAVPLPGVL